MSKRPSAQTLQKYRLTLARDAMIKKITAFIERRNNPDLLKIYRQFFRDDINSLALADSLPKEPLSHEQEWEDCSNCNGKGIYILPNSTGMTCRVCKGEGKVKCTEAKQLSEQPTDSPKPKSQG